MADPTLSRGAMAQVLEWRTLGAVFALLFAVALLPRLSLILAGVAYADDWGHSYVSHLESYRPLAALELWFWQSVFGPDYLMSKVPRVLSAMWYALAFTMLAQWASRIGIRLIPIAMTAVTALVHPAFNELILWGVLSTVSLATATATFGIVLVYTSMNGWRRVLGLALVCAAVAGSQVLAAIGAVFVLAEVAHRGYRSVIRDGAVETRWRIALVIIPPIFGLLIIVYMRFGLGLEDFASRSVGVPSNPLASKFYVFTNAFANLYQAPMGKLLGNAPALRAFWPMLLLMWLLPFGLLRIARVPMARALVLSALPISAFLVSFSPFLATPAIPSGYRVLGTAIIAIALAFVVSTGPLWAIPQLRKSLVAAKLFLIAASISATVLDIGVRHSANERDNFWRTKMQSALTDISPLELSLCRGKFQPAMTKSQDQRGILVSYNIADEDTYSVWYSPFLATYLRVSGFEASGPAIGAELPVCLEGCENPKGINLGPFTGVRIGSRKMLVCDRLASAK